VLQNFLPNLIYKLVLCVRWMVLDVTHNWINIIAQLAVELHFFFVTFYILDFPLRLINFLVASVLTFDKKWMRHNPYSYFLKAYLLEMFRLQIGRQSWTSGFLICKCMITYEDLFFSIAFYNGVNILVVNQSLKITSDWMKMEYLKNKEVSLVFFI